MSTATEVSRAYELPLTDAESAAHAKASGLRFSLGTDQLDVKLVELQGVSPAMQEVVARSTAVSSKAVQLSLCQARLGHAIQALGAAAEDDGLQAVSADGLHAVSADVGAALVSLSLLTGNYAQRDYQFFELPLAEHAAVNLAMQQAFATRQKDKAGYAEECAVVQRRRAGVQEQLTAMGRTGAGVSMSALTKEQQRLQVDSMQLLKRKEALLKTSDNLLEDYERLQSQLSLEARDAFTSFVQRRIEADITVKKLLLPLLDKHSPNRSTFFESVAM